jgi:hypothetical protein
MAAASPWLLETGTLEWAADPATRRQLEQRVAKLKALDYPPVVQADAGLPDLLPTPACRFPAATALAWGVQPARA